MLYYLFLDDDEARKPHKITWVNLPLVPWTIVRNYEDFCDIINKNGLPACLSYDHDLGEQAYNEARFQKFLKFDYSKITEKTGLDCAKFLVEKCMELNVPHPPFTVHSMNPIGRENIQKYIESYNKSREIK